MRSSSSPAILVTVALLLLLPVLYVLSWGPAIWLHGWGYIRDEPARTIYSPLEYVRQARLIGGVLTSYLLLWEPPPAAMREAIRCQRP